MKKQITNKTNLLWIDKISKLRQLAKIEHTTSYKMLFKNWCNVVSHYKTIDLMRKTKQKKTNIINLNKLQKVSKSSDFGKLVIYNRDFVLSIIKYFYRRGLASQASKIFFNVLFTLYYNDRLAYIPQKNINNFKNKLTFTNFFKKLMDAVDAINIPLKLVPKFIRKRIRKIPVYARERFQRARTWRMLSFLGKSVYSRSEVVIKEELYKLYKNEPGSILLAKLPDIYKELEKGRVYVRVPRIPPKIFKQLLNDAKNDKYNIWPREKWRNRTFVRLQVFARKKHYSKLLTVLSKRYKILKNKFFKKHNFHSMLNSYMKFYYNYTKKHTRLINAK